jgi:hypothetical protein
VLTVTVPPKLAVPVEIPVDRLVDRPVGIGVGGGGAIPSVGGVGASVSPRLPPVGAALSGSPTVTVEPAVGL